MNNFQNNKIAPNPGTGKPIKQRYWLHVRQQPRAGRACANSLDRRPIDPPPIVQLLISDFDPKSREDMDDMGDPSFTVHCSLRSASSPKTDFSVVMARNEHTGEVRVEKQINGTIDVSAFFCDEDPDPDTASPHPSSWLYCPSQTPTGNGHNLNLPATFFCFSDLSIRHAGEYRLEFQLLKMRLDGQPFPVLHSVTSDCFRIVNAKDFDHVQPSTPLVSGLIERGLGYPLKLKKGPRARISGVSVDET